MSKPQKVLLFFAYAVLFVRYLQWSFSDPFHVEIDIEYLIRQSGDHKRMMNDLKLAGENVSEFIRKNFTRTKKFPTDYKFILKWTQSYLHHSSSIYSNGQKAFIEGNCTYTNCFLTNLQSLLLDIRNFDAIIFDMENNWEFYPMLRDPYQKFIFTASEASVNFPMCHPNFDNFYNLTWTYRLDSELRWTYLSIYDKNGTFIGPNKNISWIDPMRPTPDGIIKKFISKSKAAAWFVSYCQAPSGRNKIADKIEKAMAKYDMKLDIFGTCGKMTCPKDKISECLKMLETDYYFYFAFENSLSEDYVTEKLLYPLRHYTVPVVFGGANYSRFLPPNSYINAGILNATEVARLMSDAIKDPEVYHDYFRWHNHYEYRESYKQADLCGLCRLLNEESEKRSVVKQFRQWWNSNYTALCKHENERLLLEIPADDEASPGEVERLK